MKRWIILFFCAFLFGKAGAMFGEHQYDRFHEYNISDGLINNKILCLEQDRFGFMWIGTIEGVCRFDGKNFTPFHFGTGAHSLSHFYAQDLVLSPDSNMWIATPDGLNIYDYNLDSIRVIRKELPEGNGLTSNDFTSLFYSENKNRIWIATYWDGINYYDFGTGTFSALTLPETKEGLRPNYIFQVYEDSRNNLWIGTKDGVFKYDEGKHEMKFFPTSRVTQFMEDSFGHLWILANKLYLYDNVVDEINTIEIAEEFSMHRVTCIVEDGRQNMWIGNEYFLGHIPIKNLVRPAASKKIEYVYQQGENHGLHFRSISSLFFDDQDNLWIGTYGRELCLLETEPTKFSTLPSYRFDPASLSDNKVNHVFQGKDRNIYVCTNGSGIDKLDTSLKKTGTYTSRKDVFRSLNDNSVTYGLEDTEGNLWFGTYLGGLNMLPRNRNAFTYYTHDPSDSTSLLSNEIRCVLQTTDGNIWIGTPEGLSLYQNGKFDNTFRRIVGQTIDIRIAKQLNDSILVLGTYGAGCYLYDMKNRNIVSQYFNHLDRTYNIVNDIYVEDEKIWLATQGAGLLQVNSELDFSEIVEFNTTNGLADNYVKGVIGDGEGNIWISSSKGISRIDLSNQSIQLYGERSGVQTNGFINGSSRVVLDGTAYLVFYGNDGLNLFDPQDLPVEEMPRKILFTELKINNERVRPDMQPDNPLKKNILTTPSITLKHNQSLFSIGFISIDYIHPRHTYSYILEGIDQDWHFNGSNNEITFRNLPAGNYNLKVRIEDNNHDAAVCSELSISILPPFWKTTFAYWMYVFLALALFYALWSILTMKMRAENRIKQEKNERIRDEEIHQAKLQFFTNISHELRTPLTLILGPTHTVLEHVKNTEDEEQLNIVLRNANKLLNLVNQLLDFRKVERSEMHLHIDFGNIAEVAKTQLEAFRQLQQQQHIHLSFLESGDDFFGYFDKEFMEKILTNLISNAFKYTNAGGTISVEVDIFYRDEKKWARMSVSDSGCGIAEDEKKLIFERFYQHTKSNINGWQGSGIGLHIVSKLVETHHGTITVESQVGEGSTFTVEVPVDSTFYTPEEMNSQTMVPSVSEEPVIRPQTDSNAMQADAQQSKTAILVVDDEPDMRAYIKSILMQEYDIHEASNGREALELIEQKDCQLVISDIMMPEMDGLSLCKALKTDIATSHIPVILLTAKSAIENKIEGLELGADSYIPKPFNPRHLQVRIKKLLEFREELRQKYSKNIAFCQENNVLSDDEKFLQKIVDYIRDNIQNTQLNGDQIGEAVGMSRMNLHRKLKSLTGNKTSEFIRIVRLQQAAFLLEHTGKNISEIGYEVGFATPSYFTTSFTAYYKMSPSEYARQQRTRKSDEA